MGFDIGFDGGFNGRILPLSLPHLFRPMAPPVGNPKIPEGDRVDFDVRPLREDVHRFLWWGSKKKRHFKIKVSLGHISGDS